MLYNSTLRENRYEHIFCRSIHYFLNHVFDDSVTLCIREHNQPVIHCDQQFISIVLGGNGHTHIPQDTMNNNCMGVFMHYYPKENPAFIYEQGRFLQLEKVHPLQMGICDTFKAKNDIPILNRAINVSFLGSIDPYRRADFYQSIQKAANIVPDSVFSFYQNWNAKISDRYSKTMMNTKIALVPSGASSLDTHRYYEAARCGCIILADKQNPYPFMEGAKHIEINNWDNISSTISSLLSGPNHLDQLSYSSYSFWKNNLSPKATAEYMIGRLQSVPKN